MSCRCKQAAKQARRQWFSERLVRDLPDELRLAWCSRKQQVLKGIIVLIKARKQLAQGLCAYMCALLLLLWFLS
jgi:uncharacterized membrane protein